MNNIIEKDIANIISRLDTHIEKFNNKNILLAGGGGFLGFYFTKFFQEIKRKKNINTKVTFIDNFVSSSKNFISLLLNIPFATDVLVSQFPLFSE